jgi:hypothetical protein
VITCRVCTLPIDGLPGYNTSALDLCKCRGTLVPYSGRTGNFVKITNGQRPRCASCNLRLTSGGWYDSELKAVTCTTVCAIALSTQMGKDLDHGKV